MIRYVKSIDNYIIMNYVTTVEKYETIICIFIDVFLRKYCKATVYSAKNMTHFF